MSTMPRMRFALAIFLACCSCYHTSRVYPDPPMVLGIDNNGVAVSRNRSQNPLSLLQDKSAARRAIPQQIYQDAQKAILRACALEAAQLFEDIFSDLPLLGSKPAGAELKELCARKWELEDQLLAQERSLAPKASFLGLGSWYHTASEAQLKAHLNETKQAIKAFGFSVK
mmetsp:Transcript_102881/g.197475  ORF Transcript_102881/g.197475 Transcript_102881/m.197475 type:complete len:170 (-) Transcript_102881:757-1266(-)